MQIVFQLVLIWQLRQGKSWVIYGVAAIMLASNTVDQVLILTPSVTIEEELTKKD
ncbi:MAG: hypothetical protein L6U99_12980 [Clostridium sp.]|nr:MAG: hypothetical protein L6U99_12980 [Clostridium sp.]